jgi:uncharacterized protein DUF6152
MTQKLGGALVLVGLLFSTGSVSAHHALQAQFDTLKPLTLKGALARVDWVNPHAYFWLDIKDDSGQTKQWGCETVGPTALRQAGFLRGPASFRIGDTYTFEGFAARDGSERIFMTAVHFPDGRKIQLWFGDPNAAGGPGEPGK